MLSPIRGNLQDGRPAQPSMRDQHFLPERLVVRGNLDFRGDSGQIAILLAVFCPQHERHERGPGFADLHPELAGDVIPQRGRAYFWNRKSACRYDQDWGMKFAGLGANDEFVRASNLLNVAVQNNLHSCGPAFGFEQFHDILRGAVAEKLAERLLVIGNVVFFNQRDEVRRFVPSQGGFREVGIRGIEIFRPAMEVREIAAASAGDEDLFARRDWRVPGPRRAGRACPPRSRTSARRLRRPELPHRICGP